MLQGGQISITAVNPFNGLEFLREELKELNSKYSFTEEPHLERFISLETKNRDSYYFNNSLGFEILKDNYDELFLASDFFQEVEIGEKAIKIKQAEITDERIFIKIKTTDWLDFKIAMFFTVAFCNLTDGIIDLIAFGNENLGFERQYYSKSEWEKEVIRIFEKINC